MKDWLTPGVVLAIAVWYFVMVMLPIMVSDIR